MADDDASLPADPGPEADAAADPAAAEDVAAGAGEEGAQTADGDDDGSPAPTVEGGATAAPDGDEDDNSAPLHPPPTAAPAVLVPLEGRVSSAEVPRLVRAAFMEAGGAEIVVDEEAGDATNDKQAKGGASGLAIEDGNPWQSNEVVVQLMCITPSSMSHSGTGGSIVPASSRLRFIVRFYEFAPTPTAAASLLPLDGVESMLLVQEGGGAGLILRFAVPGGVRGSASPQPESILLAEHLAGGTLVVEAWDDASLIHLGTATVELKGLLRSLPDGHAVEISRGAPLVAPVLPGQDETRANCPVGTLHMRLACLGSIAERPARKAGGAAATATATATAQVLSGPLVSMAPPRFPPRSERKALAQPARLPEPDANHRAPPRGGPSSLRGLDAERARKLSRLQLLDPVGVVGQYSAADREERQLATLRSAVAARAACRASTIETSLASTLRRTVRVECRAGVLPYFELTLPNLSGADRRKEKYELKFQASDSGDGGDRGLDAVLDLITSEDEWRVHKAVHGLRTPLSAATLSAKALPPKADKTQASAQTEKKTAEPEQTAAPPEPEPEPAGEGDPPEGGAAPKPPSLPSPQHTTYILEVPAGETVYVPCCWRVPPPAAAAGGSGVEAAPLPLVKLLGARPLPAGAVYPATAGLLHGVGAGRHSLDPTRPGVLATPAGKLTVTRLGVRAGPIAVLDVELCPRPLTVDATVHLVGGGGGLLSASIPATAARIPPPPLLLPAEDDPSGRLDAGASSGRWRVEVLQLGARGQSVEAAPDGSGIFDAHVEGGAVCLRARCPQVSDGAVAAGAGALPLVSYLFLYDTGTSGARCWRRRAVWQILLSAAQTGTVPCTAVGQANPYSILVPPSLRPSELCRFHSSNPSLLSVPQTQAAAADGDEDASPASSVLTVYAHPPRAGAYCWIMSAVLEPDDAAAAADGLASPASGGASPASSHRAAKRCLGSRWLLSTTAPAPDITRHLQLRLRRRGTLGAAPLRVQITNPYKLPRCFTVHSNRPDVLRCAGEQGTPPSPDAAAAAGPLGDGRRRLWLRASAATEVTLSCEPEWPVDGAGHKELSVLLFVNDENDKLEEVLSLRIVLVCSANDDAEPRFTTSYSRAAAAAPAAGPPARDHDDDEADESTMAQHDDGGEQDDAAQELVISVIEQAKSSELPALEAAIAKRRQQVELQCN